MSGASARFLAIAVLASSLAACVTDSGDQGAGQGGLVYTDDRGVADQPFPVDYRAQLLAFLRTYLNNPAGIRDAAIAEPAQRTVGGRRRYVSCLRYNAREIDGSYRGGVQRAVVYVDARLDRMIEKADDICAGAGYAPFPELEKLTR
ncbi:hypothetical protein NB311A_01190 [Nitrobacter sp. Nb-311A]|uniref:hypothetical protein n=1 Tax=unclassified Nitrobacter TaxID=2620411 RepID=UPI00006866DB|nr:MULTISPECIES: hypothetical protein [unclassified Nitrobacter]EAQ35944.1 hypothetical protein NB311A_01190 [Nitrobacter sp. Nb-311A]MCB1393973.1 hypothetical protein [Nitrobacter sp.]MCV0387236.1 hypothetical protein [Nitrobacter sp.]